ncbi:hypothetical protein K469DRAFT_721136 [Zopfia rhizophila CBS 207.26]|uniref:Uncharacterized protein n=1 Tax=Zopfia rhizophila CBS 207.26 TaxID=1314779 RepID=A0A6A6DFP8_9PEZI|nr:hypothetical protein K469DRAFT_721136 [Zopfia rhizophila CBS 207.26]
MVLAVAKPRLLRILQLSAGARTSSHQAQLQGDEGKLLRLHTRPCERYIDADRKPSAPAWTFQPSSTPFSPGVPAHSHTTTPAHESFLLCFCPVL